MTCELDSTRRGFAQIAGAAGLVTLGGLWTPTAAAERKHANAKKTNGSAHEEAEECSLVSENEYDSIAEQFERDEKQKFGDDGFEKMVDRVAQIERMIGIDDLAKFTPT